MDKTRLAFWEGIVRGAVADYRCLSSVCAAAIAAGAMDLNGPLHEGIWNTFDAMLARIDRDGWLAWFIFENDCGAKGLWVSWPGKKARTPVRTPRQLARLLAAADPPAGL